jgi:hypothetical protein
MEVFGGGGILILDLGTRWGRVVSVTPRPRFTPKEMTHGTHWIEGVVGPRASLDAGARRKVLCPFRGSNPNRPARSQTHYCLSYRGSLCSFTLYFLCMMLGSICRTLTSFQHIWCPWNETRALQIEPGLEPGETAISSSQTIYSNQIQRWLWQNRSHSQHPQLLSLQNQGSKQNIPIT